MEYIKIRIINMQNSIHICMQDVDWQIKAIWFLNKNVSLHKEYEEIKESYLLNMTMNVFASNYWYNDDNNLYHNHFCYYCCLGQ